MDSLIPLVLHASRDGVPEVLYPVPLKCTFRSNHVHVNAFKQTLWACKTKNFQSHGFLEIIFR